MSGEAEIEGLPERITCPLCERSSSNANDIAQGYCGNCALYTSDPHLDEIRRAVAEKYRPARWRGDCDYVGQPGYLFSITDLGD